MKKKGFVLLWVIVLVPWLYNGTITHKGSTHRREKPKVNCRGALTTKSKNEYLNVKNITFGSLHEQILVYLKTKNTKQDPRKHRAYLDLKEISIIKVLGTVTHKKQTFVELEVTTRKDNTVGGYLIEPTRIVRYDIGPEEREIDIETVDTITFEDCIKPKENNNNEK